MKTQINTLSLEEREELFRLIKADIDMVINNKPLLSEINDPDTPMKTYIRKAKMNVSTRKETQMSDITITGYCAKCRQWFTPDFLATLRLSLMQVVTFA